MTNRPPSLLPRQLQPPPILLPSQYLRLLPLVVLRPLRLIRCATCPPRRRLILCLPLNPHPPNTHTTGTSVGSDETKGKARHWTQHGASPSLPPRHSAPRRSAPAAPSRRSVLLPPSLPVREPICAPPLSSRRSALLPPPSRYARRSAPHHSTPAAPGTPLHTRSGSAHSLPLGRGAAPTDISPPPHPPTTPPPSTPQPASVDSVPVQIRTKASDDRKVCNVTRGSAKSTLEISLLAL